MIAAVVPAAGRSLRMGRPKLILPVGGLPLIVRVVRALRWGGAERVVVVAPPLREPGAARLVDEARHAGAHVLVAETAPPDMRASVELGLAEFHSAPPPRTVLLAPGDSPGLTTALVSRVVEFARANPARIVTPVVGGRRGHPVALPWERAVEIPLLPSGAGINALVRAHLADLLPLELDDPGTLADLDTPDDYQRWAGTVTE